MKAEIMKIEKPQVTYPCLKKSIYSDLVVLFTDVGVGMVVVPYLTFGIGFYYTKWEESNFEYLEAYVQLTNQP